MICEGIKSQLVGPTSRSKLLDRLTVVGLLVLAVAGCKQLQSLGRPTVLKSPDGKFQLTVPAGWRENPTLNEKADIKAGNPIQEMYVIVITEPKTDFTGDMTLEEYSNIVRDSMTSNLTSPDSTQPVPVTINGRPGLRYELQGAIRNVKLTYLVTNIETDAHYHQVITWTLQSHMDRNRATLQQVAGTFRPTL
ncbi:MAG TPA: hypothetical protein VIF64_20035 [Pyrinomonadaceae bacterium]|jgi:hypothetical protein